MARTEIDIANSIISTIQSINPTIDLLVGPVYDYLIRPLPKELASIEAEAEALKIYYSANFPNVATTQEVLDFANHFSIGPDVGGTARVSIIFYRNSAPLSGTDYTIAIGSLVATADSTLVYRTVETKTMYGDFAETYYNPTSNKFELEIMCEATGPGVIYNVPPGRITRPVTQATGFDGVDQRAQALGGSEPEDAQALASRVIAKFKGLNISSMSGIARIMKEVEPSAVLDIHIIRPTDRREFRRPTTGPALDICVSGMKQLEFSEEYLATGGESSIILATSTAMSIETVAQNGVTLTANTDFTYVPDSSPEYQLSTKASNRIEFTIPLSLNDLLEIKGISNSLLGKLQAISGGDDALFQTNMLVRSFIDLPVVVGLEVRITPSVEYDAQATEDQIAVLVQSYIESDIIPTVLTPEGFREYIRSSIPDVQSVRVFEFRRLKESIDTVEVIVPLKNQIPKYASSASSLIVRT